MLLSFSLSVAVTLLYATSSYCYVVQSKPVFTPSWVDTLYGRYSPSEDATNVQPNVFAIMSDTSASDPVHHLLQMEPNPTLKGVLQTDPEDPQGLSAILNEFSVPTEQTITLGKNPQVVLVSVRGNPENVAAVYLKDGKVPVRVNDVDNRVRPVRLQHIGGELFRVKSDDGAELSSLYNIIKSKSGMPGIYEVLRNEAGDQVFREQARSLDSVDRSLELSPVRSLKLGNLMHLLGGRKGRSQSINPTQIAQVINALQNSGNSHSTNPTQIAQVINAMQSNGLQQSFSPTQIAQVINAMQGPQQSLNPTQIAQVINTMQSGNQNSMSPVQIAQVINLMYQTDLMKVLNPTQIAQVIDAMQEVPQEERPTLAQLREIIEILRSRIQEPEVALGGKIDGVSEVAQLETPESKITQEILDLIVALRNGRENGILNFEEVKIVVALGQGKLGNRALNLRQISKIILALQLRDEEILSAQAISQITNALNYRTNYQDGSNDIGLVLATIRDIQREQTTENSGLEGRGLENYQATYLVHFLEEALNLGLTPEDIIEIINAIYLSEPLPDLTTRAGEPLKGRVSSQAGQVLHALQKNRNGLDSSKINQVIQVLQGINNDYSLNSESAANAIHAVQSSSEKALHPEQISQVIKAVQIAKGSYVNQKIKVKQNVDNNRPALQAFAEILGVIKRQKNGVAVNPSSTSSNQHVSAGQVANSQQVKQKVGAAQVNGPVVDTLTQVLTETQELEQKRKASELIANFLKRKTSFPQHQTAELTQAVQESTSFSQNGGSQQKVYANQNNRYPAYSSQGIYSSQNSGNSGSSNQNVYANQHSDSVNSKQDIYTVQNEGSSSGSNQGVYAVQHSSSPGTSQKIYSFQNDKSTSADLNSKIAQAIYTLQSTSQGKPLTRSQIAQVIGAVQSVHNKNVNSGPLDGSPAETAKGSNVQATNVKQASTGSGQQGVYTSQQTSQGASILHTGNNQ